jgi:dihydroxy-acid dehydratase
MSGGNVGLIENGDIIDIDIPGRGLNARVTEEEFAARRAKYVKPEPRVKTGYLSRYARLVTSANTGAVLE